jgi:integrase
VFAVAAYCGLRLSEVVGLVWGDVVFDAGTIHVQAQLSMPNPYDATSPHRVPLKSDSGEGAERVVFMHDDLAKLLKAHRGDRIVRRDEFVFATGAGTPFGQRNVGRAFDETLAAIQVEWTVRCDACGWQHVGSAAEHRAAKQTHLQKKHPDAKPAGWKWAQEDKPTFHSLRHTFASAIIAGGADHGHVARLLGHTDPAFTYRVYVHEFDAARRQSESKAALTAAYAGVLG